MKDKSKEFMNISSKEENNKQVLKTLNETYDFLNSRKSSNNKDQTTYKPEINHNSSSINSSTNERNIILELNNNDKLLNNVNNYINSNVLNNLVVDANIKYNGPQNTHNELNLIKNDIENSS